MGRHTGRGFLKRPYRYSSQTPLIGYGFLLGFGLFSQFSPVSPGVSPKESAEKPYSVRISAYLG